jgi:dTDP-4-dehydrorhamnose 3,5-epimerase
VNVIKTTLCDVFILEPRIFGDDRGFFFESWNARAFHDAGFEMDFVQDNHSRSAHGTLRGLHYQTEQTQGKLLRVSAGEVYDVAVDLRKSSPSYGQWLGVNLNAEKHNMLWIPQGFAHGFYVTSEYADFQYKCTNVYDPDSEVCINWNDPGLAIDWPIPFGQSPRLSDKDAKGVTFDSAPKFD